MTSSTHFSTTALRVKHAVAVTSICTHLSLPNELFFLSESFNFRIIKFL